jgi:hypothetical protein
VKLFIKVNDVISQKKLRRRGYVFVCNIASIIKVFKTQDNSHIIWWSIEDERVIRVYVYKKIGGEQNGFERDAKTISSIGRYY